MRTRADRVADWADNVFRDFLVSVFYSERTASMQPARTGSVSSCCNAHTYDRPGREARYCSECDAQCRERTLWSPNVAMSSKGGWDPSPVWKLVDGEYTWAPRDQVMYVNPTQNTRPTAQELLMARTIDRCKSLSALVEAVPRHFRKGEWKLCRLAWEGAVHPLVNSYAEVVGMASDLDWRQRIWPTESAQRCIARTLAQWEEASVGRWVDLCHYVVVTRKREHPSDYREVSKPPEGVIPKPALLSERLAERETVRAA